MVIVLDTWHYIIFSHDASFSCRIYRPVTVEKWSFFMFKWKFRNLWIAISTFLISAHLTFTLGKHQIYFSFFDIFIDNLLYFLDRRYRIFHHFVAFTIVLFFLFRIVNYSQSKNHIEGSFYLFFHFTKEHVLFKVVSRNFRIEITSNPWMLESLFNSIS